MTSHRLSRTDVTSHRRHLPVLLALVFAGCTALPEASRTVVASSEPPVERPALELGDRWIRDDGLFALAQVEPDAYVFSHTASGTVSEFRLSKDLTPVSYWTGGLRMWEFAPAPRLEWPLRVGNKGSGATTLVTTELGRIGVRETKRDVGYTWVVDRQETVNVGTHPFKAFRVDFTFGSGLGGFGSRYRMWYAPEARQVLKAEGPIWGQSFTVVGVDPKLVPLALVVHEPRDQARLDSGVITLLGRVSSGSGIARVLVTVNGEAVPTPPTPAEPSMMALDVPVTLRAGRNVVLVTVTDRGGSTRQDVRAVFYEPRAPVVGSTSPPPQSPRPPASSPPVATVPPRAPALDIQIQSPTQRMQVERETQILAASVSGGRGVSRVVVSLNGREISRPHDGRPLPSVVLDLPITLVEGQNTLIVTAVDPTGAPHQDARTVYFERPVPLRIDWQHPTERSIVTEHASTVLAAMVKASRGIVRVSAFLNGAPIPLEDAAGGATPAARTGDVRARREIGLTVPIELRPGQNIVVVRAEASDGVVQQDARTVTYEPRPDRPDWPRGRPVEPKQERWAVIIGIGKYDHPGIPTLHYATNDASAVFDVLTTIGGFKKERVLVLTDHSEQKPTLRNIRHALGTFLARAANEDDTVLIFFAGHGAPETDQAGFEADGLAKYLIPSDADPYDLYPTAFPMEEIEKVFARIKATKAIMFVDACYSGAAGGRTFMSKRTRGTLDDRFLDRLTKSRGRVVVTASRPSEVALELPTLRHGIFTYYLVQGLKGAADLDGDGIVTLNELYQYVEREVRTRARQEGGNQQPVMRGEVEGDFPLTRLRP